MDDERRALEKLLQENPDDARVQAKLARLRQREDNASFGDEVVRALRSFGQDNHSAALVVAYQIRNVVAGSNWGVAVRISDLVTHPRRAGIEYASGHREGVYVEVRCFWSDLDARARGERPSRFVVSFHRRIARERLAGGVEPVDRLELPPFGTDEVEAWAKRLVRDDGGREARYVADSARVR